MGARPEGVAQEGEAGLRGLYRKGVPGLRDLHVLFSLIAALTGSSECRLAKDTHCAFSAKFCNSEC